MPETSVPLGFKPVEEKSATPRKAQALASSQASGARRLSADDPPVSAWEYTGQEDYAGLTVHHRGAALRAADSVLILFHGYGAEGDDLLPLSRVLKLGSRVALLFPEAPVALPRGGRAWFRRDRTGFELGVKRARALLVFLRQTHPHLSLVVGGFSQGAMLSANLVEDAGVKLQAAILLSPADLLLSPLHGNSIETPIFLSHGTIDPVLPFSGSEALRDRFTGKGYQVTWFPFHGRHGIPREVLVELNRFLATQATK